MARIPFQYVIVSAAGNSVLSCIHDSMANMIPKAEKKEPKLFTIIIHGFQLMISNAMLILSHHKVKIMADFTRLFDLFDYQNVSHPREDALNYKYGGVWKNYSSQDCVDFRR